MIKLLSTDTDFTETLANYFENLQHEGEDFSYLKEVTSILRATLHLTSPQPWCIPLESELAPIWALTRTQHDRALGRNYVDPKFIDRIKLRFSAASVAIHFLKTAQETTRSAIKDIVLHEDRPSVADPESHMLELIPFCLQNSKLHIQRRVNIWRNVCGIQLGGMEAYEFVSLLEGLFVDQELASLYDEYYKWMDTMAAWLNEASYLPAKGMAAGSFSLIFEGDFGGDSAQAQSSEMFEMVKRLLPGRSRNYSGMLPENEVPTLRTSAQHSPYTGQKYSRKPSTI